MNPKRKAASKIDMGGSMILWTPGLEGPGSANIKWKNMGVKNSVPYNDRFCKSRRTDF